MTGIVTALWLCALPADAPQEDNPEAFAVAAVEIELYHLGFLAFSNVVTREPFARVSWDSVTSHFDGRRSWTFDDDYYLTNQLGHPYQGALYFTASRSAGLSFGSATFYTFVGSLLWELFCEVDAPSINDQITTTLGGAFLGEMMYRAALAIWDGQTGAPRFLAALASFLIDPAGTFNRWLSGAPMGVGSTLPATWSGEVIVGVSLVSRLRDEATGTLVASDGIQPHVELQLTHQAAGSDDPFSYFDLTARLSTGPFPLGALFLRGLLWGERFETPGRSLTGVWGVFGQYDFTQPVVFRASVVGFGPGVVAMWRFSENGFVRAIAVASAVPFGSVGSLGRDEELYRDYHIGPGYAGAAQLELGHAQAGVLRVGLQQWMVVGAYTPPSGYELMTQLTMGVTVHLGGHIAAGLELVSSWRAPYFDDETYNRAVRGSTLRLSLSWLLDDGFGGPAPSAR